MVKHNLKKLLICLTYLSPLVKLLIIVIPNIKQIKLQVSYSDQNLVYALYLTFQNVLELDFSTF